MKIRELFEGISPVVYHYTDIWKLVGILSEDRFRLTTAVHNPSEMEHQRGKYYWMSTTRTRTGKYHIDSLGGVLIKLDGRRLSYNYAGSPIDYWGPDFRNIDPRTEQEDRIFSNEPYIDHATRYILSVDILYNDAKHMTKDPNQLFNAIKILSRKGIPYNVYDNNRDFITGNARNAIPHSELMNIMRGNTQEVPAGRWGYERDHLKRERGADVDLRVLLKSMIFDDISKFDSEERRRLSNFLRYYYIDGVRGMQTTVHNNSKTGEVNLVNTIVREMRRRGIRTIKELGEYMYTKWNSKI